VTVFVDTSVWYAATDSGDVDNARARAILAGSEPLVTTDHVLVETWGLLRNRARRQIADRFWDTLRNGLSAIEQVTTADLEMAWQIGSTYPDQDFSIVDRTSFAVMRRLGIARAAFFDHHFAIFRFGPDRRRAFTIVH
jgi:predicted nucleic acid-binding protein